MRSVWASVRRFPNIPSDLALGEHAMTSLPLAARLTCVHASSRAWLYGAAAALALQFAVAMPVRAAADDPVVARVNGTEIRASDLAIAEEDVGSNLPMTGEARREYLTKYLSDMILVAQAAEAKKLQDRDDFKQRLAYSREKLLMEMMLQQEGKASISEAALRQLYQEAVKQMAGEKEVHARHILVESEDQAKAVLAELKKGADFASLAKEKSKDPGAGNGGDLGFFTKDQMVPEFAQAAFKLEPGQLSDPVKTQFGWHVIKVEEKRERPIPEFDKVRDQLETFLQRRTQADLINKLRASANIEKPDAGPELAPLPAPGASKQK
jgi:peptidyl-prolyl cis-trans isomerase C